MGNRSSARRFARTISRDSFPSRFRAVLLATLASLTWAAVARANDATILGRALDVRNESSESARTVTMTARETPTDLATIADPRLGGATLTVVLTGGMPSSQTFALDAGRWSVAPGGYRYRAAKSASGPPVRRVLLTAEPGGAAKMTVVLRGDTGTDPLLVLPPDPGTEGGLALGIGEARYCVRFGGPAGGTIRSDRATRWRVVQPLAEAGCLDPPPPPLCGDDVVEGDETCDGSASTACDEFQSSVTCGAPDSSMPCSCCYPDGTTFVDPSGAGGPCCNGTGFQTAQYEFYCGSCLPDLSSCLNGPGSCCSGTCFAVAGLPFELCGSCRAAGTPCVPGYPEICCSGSCGAGGLCD